MSGPEDHRAPTPAGAGPPLPGVAAVSAALFVAGLVVPIALSGQPYPSPFQGGDALAVYLAQHPDALRAAALFHFASSVPLAVFSASVVARLHALGVRAAGSLIALAGGVLASAALALSGCAQWVLARVGQDAPPGLARSLHELVFLTAGPWHVVALGLLLAGIAVSAGFYRLLPPVMWVIGVVLAVICELTTLVFVSDSAAYLLPVGRFGGLIWLIAAGFVLPRSRPRRS